MRPNSWPATRAEPASAIADEEAAEREWQTARRKWNATQAELQAEIELLAEQVRALSFVLDERGTDIHGALLRAAESLSGSHRTEEAYSRRV